MPYVARAAVFRFGIHNGLLSSAGGVQYSVHSSVAMCTVRQW